MVQAITYAVLQALGCIIMLCVAVVATIAALSASYAFCSWVLNGAPVAGL